MHNLEPKLQIFMKNLSGTSQNSIQTNQPQSFGSQNENGDIFQPRQYPNCYACLPANIKGNVCPHTGLRHAHLAKLLKPGGMAAAYVRVVFLREPGARRGKTLFHVGDMLQWLDELAVKRDSGTSVKGKSIVDKTGEST
jgi:hypothetical protein